MPSSEKSSVSGRSTKLSDMTLGVSPSCMSRTWSALYCASWCARAGACSTIVVTPWMPCAECDLSHGFLGSLVKTTLVAITQRTGNKNLCPCGMLRIISGCLPSHLPLAKARVGISRESFTRHMRHALHTFTADLPSRASWLTLLECSRNCRIIKVPAIFTLTDDLRPRVDILLRVQQACNLLRFLEAALAPSQPKVLQLF